MAIVAGRPVIGAGWTCWRCCWSCRWPGCWSCAARGRRACAALGSRARRRASRPGAASWPERAAPGAHRRRAAAAAGLRHRPASGCLCCSSRRPRRAGCAPRGCGSRACATARGAARAAGVPVITGGGDAGAPPGTSRRHLASSAATGRRLSAVRRCGAGCSCPAAQQLQPLGRAGPRARRWCAARCSMSQCVRAGLTGLRPRGARRPRSSACAPQRHSHSGGTSASIDERQRRRRGPAGRGTSTSWRGALAGSRARTRGSGPPAWSRAGYVRSWLAPCLGHPVRTAGHDAHTAPDCSGRMYVDPCSRDGRRCTRSCEGSDHRRTACCRRRRCPARHVDPGEQQRRRRTKNTTRDDDRRAVGAGQLVARARTAASRTSSCRARRPGTG